MSPRPAIDARRDLNFDVPGSDQGVLLELAAYADQVLVATDEMWPPMIRASVCREGLRTIAAVCRREASAITTKESKHVSVFKQGRETYKSDIVLGGRYRDKQTGVEGHATALHFYQHACERVTLEAVSGKTGDLMEYGFDAPRLVAVKAPDIPVRQQRTGGPARAGEARPAPSGTR